MGADSMSWNAGHNEFFNGMGFDDARVVLGTALNPEQVHPFLQDDAHATILVFLMQQETAQHLLAQADARILSHFTGSRPAIPMPSKVLQTCRDHDQWPYPGGFHGVREFHVLQIRRLQETHLGDLARGWPRCEDCWLGSGSGARLLVGG